MGRVILLRKVGYASGYEAIWTSTSQLQSSGLSPHALIMESEDHTVDRGSCIRFVSAKVLNSSLDALNSGGTSLLVSRSKDEKKMSMSGPGAQ